ncbi:MAG: hypothetical protein AAGA48_32655 [Myxococcota bacterium]
MWDDVPLTWHVVDGASVVTTQDPDEEDARYPIEAITQTTLDLAFDQSTPPVVPTEISLRLLSEPGRFAGTIRGWGDLNVDSKVYREVGWSMLAICDDCATTPPATVDP